MAPAQAAPTIGGSAEPTGVGSDALPNPIAEKQAALREQAISDVLSGKAKVQTINGQQVVQVTSENASANGQGNGNDQGKGHDQGKGKGKGHDQGKGHGKGGKDSYQSKYVPVAHEGTDRIFVVLVEFGDQQPTFPLDPKAQRHEGPLHNQIPEPDRTKDNSTVWAADHSQAYFQNLYFGEGESLKNYMTTQSSGRYSVDGTVTDWVKVPFTEGRYGTNRCGQTNCGDVKLLIQDAAKAWVDGQLADGRTMDDIKAELATFDVQDRYDLDGDGDFNEPDGWIDHFQIVHAGGDEADGDPIYGTDAVWSHRWYSNLAYGPSCFDGRACLTGAPIGGTVNPDGTVASTDDYTGFYVGDYTIQPENGGRSVFYHEFTHDLGLPDDYNSVTASGDNSNEYWTLMAQSRLGGATDGGIGERAGDLGAWNKLQLGWLDYDYLTAGQKKTVKLGASEYNNKDAQAVIVGLPPKPVQHDLPAPYAGSGVYYSGHTNNSIITLKQTVTVPTTDPVLSFQTIYDLETDYDYAQVTANGAPLTAWDGTQAAWGPMTVDLSAYAGQSVELAFSYVTDPAVSGNDPDVPDGVLLDDIRLGGTLIGDGEGGLGAWTTNGWVAAGAQYTTYHPGYYIAANRTYVSYDQYLKTGPYYFGYGAALPDKVDHFAYQQGLLVSYWDTSVDDNDVNVHPGSGRNLYVDSHPAPFKQTSTGALWRPRVQIYDAPFSLAKTDTVTLHVDGVANTFGGLPGNPVFRDTDKYFYEESPNQGVKLPGVGVTMTILKQNGTTMNVKVD
ncbi:immune inhibitor A domain-containing protein [Xylanimonas protaetiae]|uniref:M6 family metalloprotease domain-containing protein n=1 Tax=Xylanimonas protaetiae TaxID=2509457 RepID=A0A4P6F783_9MICO|nr:immune inhibitor A domain-containing protein [Xylanimonas protaetiae]QAY71544.1 M6 family metalloprotease domain-containing protein [Xylanimonas protaetiae]